MAAYALVFFTFCALQRYVRFLPEKCPIKLHGRTQVVTKWCVCNSPSTFIPPCVGADALYRPTVLYASWGECQLTHHLIEMALRSLCFVIDDR